MKKSIIISVLILCAMLLALSACGNTGDGKDTTDANVTADQSSTADTTTNASETYPPAPADIKLHSITELNTDGVIDDHIGENFAAIELDYRNYREYSQMALNSSKPFYPRVKRMADGRYIMFYQQGQHSWSTYFIIGNSLTSFKGARVLFQQEAIPEHSDTRCYMTTDAVVLKNGDIIAVSSYRANKKCYTNPELGGLAIRRSTDNGKTWSDIETIYVGMNWEPYIRETESGEIQIFFTHTSHKIYKDGVEHSSGVGLIRSTDGGKTWTPKVDGAPFEAQIVSQYKVFTDSKTGADVFTNQMPCAITLHNGKTFLVYEQALRTSFDQNESFRIGYCFNDDNFSKYIGTNEVGPQGQRTNAYSGAGPYAAQFKSGEIIVSYHWSNTYRYRMSLSNGSSWTAEMRAYDNGGFWGANELTGDHSIAVVAGSTGSDDAKGYYLITGEFRLNHSLNSKIGTVSVDGDPSDWENNKDALFVGSLSETQGSFRYSKDGKYVYCLAEVLDNHLVTGDKVAFFISGGDKNILRITVELDGGIEISKKEANAKTFEKISNSDILSAVAYVGNIDETEGGRDDGYAVEIAIPVELISAFNGSTVYVNCAVYNKDKKSEKSTSDSIDGLSLSEITNWIPVRFK